MIEKTENEIILMIDANEGFSGRNSYKSKILTKTQMYDPIFLQHGSEMNLIPKREVPSVSIFFFCTSNISQFIIRSGILSFDSVTTTDHRALY